VIEFLTDLARLVLEVLLALMAVGVLVNLLWR
jgi:hypothetical protein